MKRGYVFEIVDLDTKAQAIEAGAHPKDQRALDAKMEELARAGYQNVLVVPISFVSDHIETLYEIDLLYGVLARKLDFQKFWRTESLNFAPDFTDALAQIVFDHLQSGRTTFAD